MRRFSQNVLKFTEILIILCLLTAAVLLTGCAEEPEGNAHPVKTAEEWNRAVENTYVSLTDPKASYILETSYGGTKTYTVSGDKCEAKQKGDVRYYYRTEDKFYTFEYREGTGYLKKEASATYSSVGAFVLDEVFSASYLEDFLSLKDCFPFFTAGSEGIYALNETGQTLFAQKVFGEEGAAPFERLDVSIKFQQNLIENIVLKIGGGETAKTEKITIRWSYRTVTLPTYTESRADAASEIR